MTKKRRQRSDAGGVHAKQGSMLDVMKRAVKRVRQQERRGYVHRSSQEAKSKKAAQSREHRVRRRIERASYIPEDFACGNCGRLCLRSKQWVVYEPKAAPVWNAGRQSYELVETRLALCLACHRKSWVAACVLCGRRVGGEDGVWWRLGEEECVCTRCTRGW